jgi:hypothetical protein
MPLAAVLAIIVLAVSVVLGLFLGWFGYHEEGPRTGRPTRY